MKVIIIEDEPHAAQRLRKLLTELDPAISVIGELDSVKRAVEWFKTQSPPDLVLMDIQLADGLSFHIFEQCTVTAPVIFTTAYDEYALKAFKVNSVDYILKPVDKTELDAALRKLKGLQHSADNNRLMIDNIGEAVQMLLKKYKTRFVIRVGEHLKMIDVEAIRFFYSQDKATFCVTSEGRSFIVDYPLEDLEDMLDPRKFFRINRKYIVKSESIQDIITYSNSRLRLILKGADDQDIVVARERVQLFKEWLDQ